VFGFEGIDSLQAEIQVVGSEKEAEEVVEARLEKLREQEELSELEALWNQESDRGLKGMMAMSRSQKLRAKRIAASQGPAAAAAAAAEQKEAEEEEEGKTLNVLVKSDTVNSLEVLLDYFAQLPEDDVTINVIRSGVGDVSEADVLFAKKFKAVIFGFRVKATSSVQAKARSMEVPISTHEVIYNLMDDIKEKVEEKMPLITKVWVTGKAEILKLFPLSQGTRKATIAAGCRVRTGELYHRDMFRILRDNVPIWEGKLKSLRHLKEEVTIVDKGMECGMVFEDFTDFKEGDIVEAVRTEVIRKPFDDRAARQFERISVEHHIEEMEKRAATIASILKATGAKKQAE